MDDLFDDGTPASKLRPIVARYDSECCVCDGMIWQGDPIVSDGHGEWMHEDCADD